MSTANKTDKAESKEGSKDGAKSARKGLSKNIKKIIPFVLAGLVFIGLMAGGSIFLINSLSEEDPELAFAVNEEGTHADSEGGKEENNKNEHDKEARKSAALYFNMQPAFVVNFEGKDGQHFLQVDVTLMTHDAAMEDLAKTHMPLLRNAMVMLLGSQSFEDIQTGEGKEKLRQQSLLDLQAVLKKETGKAAIEDIFFTSIVMQ